MKAKEYVEKLQQANFSKEAIAELVQKFGKEIVELAEHRNGYSYDAFMGILKQQFQKWKAISRQTEGRLKEEGFFSMLEVICGEDAQKIVAIAKRELL